RHAVDVHFAGVAAFWFEEQLMVRLVGEAHYLVLNRWAISRAAGGDLPAVHRGAFEVGANQVVHGRVGGGNKARQLLDVDPIREKRKGLRAVIAELQLGAVIVDGAPVETRRRASLESLQSHAKSAER